ncbi:pyridoxal phosphate-dependent aminotransferase [Bifidobacterium pullorum subsp. saeculare]|uniref:cysteine-S-conjugate beta-lyase n=1 Tax=Bifidobacterium pullorum subsp. saeculare TaxID=78257 RepID=A0A939BAR9_9BIFI|nr:MalY/PatB family protein [Bifidobacterium pullorum]MBM6700161.1 pyridoxal phosphate-dependent aminotransferase [Bifidobacterium pullorum subsp. saeculare]
MAVYDFDTLVDRRHTSSEKWHLIEQDMGPGNDDVIALSVADMEFKPAPEIVDALVEAAKTDIFGYDYATDGYFDALVGWMERRHGLAVDPAWVSLSDGVMPAVNTALRAVTHPGDKVIIQRPVYYPFMRAAENNGLTILDNALTLADGRYTIDFDDLAAKARDPRCTAMLLCNPHNPVGRVWTPEELRRIGDICIREGVALLVDEIHADFAYPGHQVTLFSTLGERYARHCIEFTAPTKTFNLAGLLCSNVIIPDPELKERFDVAAENIAGLTVSHFGLVACQAAYEHAGPWLDALMEVLEANLALVRDFAARTEGIELIEPEGTYLAWLDCRGLGMDADALREFMRGKARVYLDEGILFGQSGAGFERVNLACPTALLRRALDQIGAAIAAR